MSISRSVLTSCMISAIGNSGARSAGPIGWPVPGCRTAGGGAGRSAAMLYQRRGIRSSGSKNLRVLSSDIEVLLWQHSGLGLDSSSHATNQYRSLFSRVKIVPGGTQKDIEPQRTQRGAEKNIGKESPQIAR